MLDQPPLQLAPRVSRLRRSPTAAISQRVAELAAQGRSVTNLGEGELDFDTPQFIREAAHAAIESGQTKYTAVSGTPALKDAIVRKFADDNGLTYRTDEVIAGAGAKPLILNALMATVSEGDEVIIPAPYWVSYPDMVSLCGGTPVIVECARDTFLLSPDALEAAITERTCWLILNSPNNPSGALYSREALAALGEVLLRHPHVLVLCDDIYEHLVYGNGVFATLPEVVPALKDRCLVVNGVSKAYSMTGWRLGYAAGPRTLIAAMDTLQSQSTTNASSISQAAAVAALSETRSFLGDWMARLTERRAIVLDAISRTRGLSADPPGAAFYVYASCAGLIGCKTPDGRELANDLDVATYLLDEAGVGVVHGAAFGMSPYLRIAFAVETATLKRAMDAIQSACAKLV
ncbi:aminotransferase class I/II-fold pyridoxal phosphate-dependent enzyme [Acuticoccus kandeliae]|uniref:aminotransferase class I/II-fold pyridoxal phosphate-dependent enzyme n=1 Tax=Acuticoccus kandeliae TaxID=2073160 RepID=UPI000D3E0D05|nr:aminotransferase class I/II-fold pyridoxal phosphate-dependent enzyme [Acuticoccus kandeliae]